MSISNAYTKPEMNVAYANLACGQAPCYLKKKLYT